MTHSWPPPLTAIHTPSTAEPSKFPFPAKDSQHISSATLNQKQYDTSSKTHSNSQQGTSVSIPACSSMLKDDLQLSDSEDSDSGQTPEKPPSASAPPSAPQALPAAAASAHSSSAESESTSDSDSSSDSESESSSSDSEENEPREAPAPEPEPPTTNKWQLDNWLTKVSQPAPPAEAPGGAEPPARHPDSKGKGGDGATGGHERSESKEPPPKSSSKAPRVPSEGPHAGKRSCQKSPAQQEPPQRQTVGSKQPKKPVKASAPGHADARASLLVESEPGLPPQASKDQPSKDKPKVKTKGRPRAAESREPKPVAPTPSERKKHRSGPPAPPKAPPKDAAEDRSPEHFALVPLTQSQGPARSGGARTSGCRLAVVVQEDRRKDKPLVPLRDTKLLSPLRDTPLPQSLMVKITLDLLSRIPQPPGKGSRPKKPEDKQPSAGKKPDSEKRSSENSSKLAKKRKGEAERDHDSKKIRLEKEVKSQSSPSSSHKESSKSKTPRPSSEPSKKEMLPPSLVSSSSSSSQKPAKPAQKRSRQEADPSGQDPPKSASSTKGNHRDSSVSKHRKVEGKGSGSSTEHKGSSGDTANRFPVPSLPNGNSKPGKPHMKLDKQQADFHMKEAKRLKDKAELVTDKVGKAFKYLEAALSFIECGIAMELESPASKSACSIYAETLDLIKFIMSLKSFSDATTPTQEKIFAVLCMRCQSILNMAMFRCKKDIAIKYSRTLNEHFFKTSSKVAQAPSPCIARSTGTPSPLSPMPSPASSIGSQSGAGSVGSGGVPATISTPVTIQNMTSSYVTITSHVLTAFDLWEQAEVLTRKNKEFFAQLGTGVCALALDSSLMDLVRYTRQGFQRLKQVTKTP
ncbi:AF4/FMR2 family member 1 isoform X10 [Eschrichtius robustus]